MLNFRFIRRFLSISLFFCMSPFVYAQMKPQGSFVFDYQNEPLDRFLSKNIRYPASLAMSSDSCTKLTIGFCMSFVIDASGKTSGILFSDNVPPVLQREMTRMIHLTSSHWKAVGKPRTQTMVLPLLFIRGDCQDAPLEGFTGNRYRNVLKTITDFMYTTSQQNKDSFVVLPLIEIIGYIPKE